MYREKNCEKYRVKGGNIYTPFLEFIGTWKCNFNNPNQTGIFVFAKVGFIIYSVIKLRVKSDIHVRQSDAFNMHSIMA